MPKKIIVSPSKEPLTQAKNVLTITQFLSTSSLLTFGATRQQTGNQAQAQIGKGIECNGASQMPLPKWAGLIGWMAVMGEKVKQATCLPLVNLEAFDVNHKEKPMQ